VKPPSNEWGILSDSAQGMKCLTCKYTSHNCIHVKHVLNSVENVTCPDFVGDFYEYCTACASNQNSATRSAPHCLSYQKIPFNKPGAVKGLLHGQDTVSAAGENDVCPLCVEVAFPLVNSPTWKDVTLYTQYERRVVKGISVT